MACVGGQYLLAGFSTVMIVLALIVLGQMETRFNLKPLRVSYSVVTAKPADDIVDEINSTLKESGREMHNMRLSRINGQRRVDFSVEGTRGDHKALADRMRLSPDLRDFEAVVESPDES
jgi:uncharacterized membrane protein YhiD involved in acid resistance